MIDSFDEWSKAANADRLLMLGLARAHTGDTAYSLDMAADVISKMRVAECRQMLAASAQMLAAAFNMITDGWDGMSVDEFMDDLAEAFADGST